MPRPLPDPALVDEVLALAASSSPEQAAEQLTERGVKVSYRTIYTWRDKRAADPAWPRAAAPAAGKPPSDRPPPSPRSAKPLAPSGDLVLVRRILMARDQSALAELDAGLEVAARGEHALMEWLARPLPTPEDDDAIDPLEACSRALSVATAHLEHVPPLHARAASLSTAVANLAARVEKIAAGRPRADTPDEVTERINRRKDDAVKMIMQYTSDAKAKLEADQRDLLAWSRENMAPTAAAELERRLGAMLGGAP